MLGQTTMCCAQFSNWQRLQSLIQTHHDAAADFRIVVVRQRPAL
jgi:hypothetical protein